MSRTINPELVKRLRVQKNWSQEELAIAADLSARTIQRLEAEGKGSVNSIKSIASALEVDMHNLEDKPRTQLLGVRLGYGGVLLGVTAAVVSLAVSGFSGDATAHELGVGFGVVGAIAGASCAFINWASSRQ